MILSLPTWLRGGTWFRRQRFSFLQTPSFRDGELELVLPSDDYVESVLAAAWHPETKALAPDLASLTRRQLDDFLASCPGGRQKGDSRTGAVPTYHFWMLNHDRPDLRIAGAVAWRIGGGDDVELYYGHVGYHVYPPHRGRHFAERAVRLLFPLARRHGVNPLWITCNPDNPASQKTCLHLGGKFVDTVAVPPGHPLFERGEVAKCRYRVDDVPDENSRRPS
ncbi:MAG: GNAT family N-acetyltransferase [Tepidisphaeraceae bacterium]